MKVRYKNPEGENEYLSPGDRLVSFASFSVYVADVPGGGRSATRSTIEIEEGDEIEYIGSENRVIGGFRVPIFKFNLVKFDEYDNAKDDEAITFFVVNVESILKWSEKI